jgi:hypothetical protein
MTREYFEQGESADCLAYQALLTAFFDGEATASQAASAQAHLQTCAACARAWQSWQQAQSALQALPAIPVPASLSTSVHLTSAKAQPLSASAARAEQKQAEQARAERLLEETLFEAARGYEPQPFTPVLQSFFSDVAVPSDLKQKILIATVAAPPKQSTVARMLQGLRESATALLAPRPVRWVGALAVPAMAAFLIFASQTPESINTTLVKPSVSPSEKATSAPATRFSVAPSVTPKTTKSGIVAQDKPAASTSSDKAQAATSPQTYEPSPANANTIRWEADAQHAQLVHAVAPGRGTTSGSAVRVAAIPQPRLTPVSTSKLIRRYVSHIRPRLLDMRFTGGENGLISQARLITTPDAPMRDTAPAPRTGVRLAEDLDTPDQLSSIVNDYRASLIERNNDNDDDDDDLDELL